MERGSEMALTRGGSGWRGRGRGSSSGSGPPYEQHGNSNDGNESLTRLREEISSLKRRAYKGLLWSLRMDHQKINWGLELAIDEIKKALDISQSEHTDIVKSLDKDFRKFEAEVNRRVQVARSNFEPGVRRTYSSSFPEMMETNEDEGQNPRQYNEYVVGKEAWIKWAADGQFRRVLIIDYDMLNGAHQILHVEENLYEWLNLNELLPEDIQFNHPIQEVPQDTIEIYETEQLINMVEKVLTESSEPVLLNQALKYLEKQKRHLDTGLKAIGHRIDKLRDEEQIGHQFAENGDNNDGRDNGEYMADEDNEDDDGGNSEHSVDEDNEDDDGGNSEHSVDEDNEDDDRGNNEYRSDEGNEDNDDDNVNDDEQEGQYDDSDREIDVSGNKGSDDENVGDGATGDATLGNDSDHLSIDSDN